MSNRLNHTYGLDPNYATENKWFLYLPIKNVLGKAAENLDLAIEQFYIPGLELSTSSVSFKGYNYTVPGGKLINSGEKLLKFRYLINDDWYNYATLYTWAAKLGILNNETDVNKTIQDAANDKDNLDFLTARLYLLSPFKKKVVEFIFEYAFLKNFGELLMSYENSKPMMHDITMVYNFYKIQRHVPVFPDEENKNDDKKTSD